MRRLKKKIMGWEMKTWPPRWALNRSVPSYHHPAEEYTLIAVKENGTTVVPFFFLITVAASDVEEKL
jgi:hypothetical protein